MPWHNTSPDSTDNNTAAPDRPPAVRQLRADLEQLRIGLPARFRPTLEGLLQALPSLLFPDDGWPMVPNHADLLENNIHVDPETGRRLRLEGRHRRPVRHIPLGGSRACSAGTPRPLAGAGCTAPRRCARFWAAFADAAGSGVALDRVEAARLLGIFLKFGFEWVDGSTRQPLQETSRGLTFLEAVALNIDVNE